MGRSWGRRNACLSRSSASLRIPLQQVWGGVRMVPLLERQAQAAKVVAALGAAAAAHESERAALLAVVEEGQQSALELVNATLAAQRDTALGDADAALQSGTLDAAGHLAEVEAAEQEWAAAVAELRSAAAWCPGLPFYEPGSWWQRAGRRDAKLA